VHTLELGLVSIGDARTTSALKGPKADTQARAMAILQEPCSSAQVAMEARHIGSIADTMGMAKKDGQGQVCSMGGKVQEL